MANILDADPKLAAQLDAWRDYSPDLVPICRNGGLLGFFSRSASDINPLPDPLPVADYVVGMELLGYRFDAIEQSDGTRSLSFSFPIKDSPDEWERHATNVSAAFGQDRYAEVFAFVADRDGIQKMSSASVVHTAFGNRPRPDFDDGGPDRAA